MRKTAIWILVLAFTFSDVAAQFKGKLPVITAPKFKKDTLNITREGAVPDGKTLNTKSIQSTIDALGKKGGGVVLFHQRF